MSLSPSAELEALRSEYRQSLQGKLESLQAQWTQVSAGAAPTALVRALHTLAGSAGTFGLPQVSKAAGAAEEFLEQAATPLGAQDKQRFEQLLRALSAASGLSR